MRQRLSEVVRLIDQTFKRSTDELLTEANRDGAGAISNANREELLAIVIKGYVYTAFDPDCTHR